MIEEDFLEIPEEEHKYYLDIFREAEYFAAIKVGGECLNDYFAESLKKLHCLELYPVVVHGGGKQIDESLKKADIKSDKPGGKRVTKDEETLRIVVETLKGLNQEFVYRINRNEKIAEGLNGIFYVDGPDPVYGFVGNIEGFDKDIIDNCLGRRLTPIVSCMGVGSDNKKQYYNQNADEAFGYLVPELEPKRVIMLTPKGGVEKDLKIVSEMTIEELEEFIECGYASHGMGFKLDIALELLKKGYDVQIAGPEGLIRELFTHKGSGTYLHGVKSS